MLVTVFAMARTSSRLKAMGLAGALCFRMLSRRAVFLEGLAMGVGALAAAGAGAWAGADFRADVGDFAGADLAGFAAGFFAEGFGLCLAMGRIGEGKKA